MNIYQSKNIAAITISRFTIEGIQPATGLLHPVFLVLTHTNSSTVYPVRVPKNVPGKGPDGAYEGPGSSLSAQSSDAIARNLRTPT